MKTTITKKFLTFILLVSGMFSFSVANAQSCPGNKVRVYKCGGNCTSHTKCIDPDQLNNALAHGWKLFNLPCCWVRLDKTAAKSAVALIVYPNPAPGSTTISFSLEQSQKASLKVFDMNGSLVSTLADKMFEEGENEIQWKADNVNTGVYFLQFQSAENLLREKLFVSK